MIKREDQVQQSGVSKMFEGDGEMATLMRAYNWDAHPLGNPKYWPLSLQANIRLMLHSAFPMFIWWSDEFYMFHNDAYLPALGKKHPAALGASARHMWNEIWGQLGVVAEGILQGANHFYAEELLVLLDREGFIEETYWTLSYSPVFNDAGEVEGVFCACSEVTSTVLGQRRLATLMDTRAAIIQGQTLENTCQVAVDIFGTDKNDVPFSLIYLLENEGTTARLACFAGDISLHHRPGSVDLAAGDEKQIWPLGKVLKAKKEVRVTGLNETYLLKADPDVELVVQEAVMLPILSPGENEIIGFLVCGISPRLSYDINYLNFHKLIAGQFSTLITTVKARENFMRQQAMLKEVFEQAPVAITIMNGPDYVVELANPAMCALWGRKQAEVLDRPVLEALPEVKEQGIGELLDQVYNTGIPYKNDELAVKLERNGIMETVYVSFVYQPLYNAERQITGIICLAVDINQQVEARHKIEHINKELMTTNADLDNFVYAASHDLKAPISNIEGLMEALIDYLPGATLANKEVQQVIQYISDSINRFKRAVNDLTQVARVQREGGEDIELVSLTGVVEEVLLDFQTTIAEVGAEVVVNTGNTASIEFSTKNVRSVVYNLVSNALKYHAPDRKPKVIIATSETKEFVVLTVTDNGLGLNAAEKEKIFSMFKRLHDHVEGSGVGLYIVKKIVENAGGKIEVESKKDVGTTFTIYFKR